MATLTVVNSIQVQGANSPLTITPVQGTGAVTITSNIPTYSSSDGITMENQAGTPVNYNFKGTYENITGGPGITFEGTGGQYEISADIVSVKTTGTGITTITNQTTGEVEINADIAGFTGPFPGISFSGPDISGIVTITPNVCDVVRGNGILCSRPNGNETAIQVDATVAQILPGAGIGVSSNNSTGVYTVSADVADLTSTLGSGILINSNAQNVYSASLNLLLPTNSGLQQQTGPNGVKELDVTYNNLTNGVGTVVSRVPGATPTASINANVASLNPTSKGITTASDANNEWTITNTGVISIDSSSPAIGVSTDPTSGIATLTFNPSQTFADNQVLSGSMQVPILVGGKIQGTHFNGYPTYEGNTITCIQPAYGALNPGDCLISAGANVFSVSNGVITGSGLQSVPGITGFTYLTLAQQALNVPYAPAPAPFNTDVIFFSYYEAQASQTSGNYTGYNVAAYKLDGGNVQPFFSLYSNDYAMVPANGIAVNAGNMWSLITGPQGLWIGQPFINTQVNMATLLGNGSYSNPVITRVYNRFNAADALLFSRARCFCTQEGGGLVEIDLYAGAPYFSNVTPVVGSPISSGWYPLKVVPLQDQWVEDGSTGKFNYLIYMSNSIITSVYNTQSQTWSSLSQPGYVGAFSNGLITSVADPNDTIYSQYLNGGLIASDLPTLPSGDFPTWSSSSQSAAVFFPVTLNFSDVITFGSTEGLLYQSTFTPDVTEIVGNILQIKAVDELTLVTAGDCILSSASLEITNTTMSLATGTADIDCDSLAIHSGSIDMDPGTQLNADAIVTNTLNASGPAVFSNSVVLPSASTSVMRGTLYRLPLIQSFLSPYFNTLGVLSNILITVTIPFPVPFPSNNVIVTLTPSFNTPLGGPTITYAVNGVTAGEFNVVLLFTPFPGSILTPSQTRFMVHAMEATA
jgi:hypothetical protein